MNEKQKYLNHICQLAENVWGREAEIDLCLEEMGELTQALIKQRRYREDPQRVFDIIEEIGDLEICLHQMKRFFITDREKLKLYRDSKNYKLDRSEDRAIEILSENKKI